MRLRHVALLVASLAPLPSLAAAEDGERYSGAERLSLRPLATDPALDAMPAWSPDGRRIVFHSRRSPENEKTIPTRKIWIMERNGTGARRLTEGASDDYHASFSPDGRRIVFVSERNGSRDVWVMDGDGRNLLPLTDDPGLEDHACWSPEGKRIVYAALPRDGGNFDLWTMNADGSGKHRITSSSANEIFPAWHPRGDRIAFATDAAGSFDLHAIHLAEEQIVPLFASGAQETRPAWSPDGTKLAFTRWPGDKTSLAATLWLANADGSAPTELDLPLSSTHPAWSPDGVELAFQKKEGASWDVWSARLPAALVKSGRLHLASALRGASEDVVKLVGGGVVRGTVLAERLELRTTYAAISFPREVVASIQFAELEKGTARVVLANGDSFNGFLLQDEILVRSSSTRQALRRETIESIGFRAAASAARGREQRILMRNGDSFAGRLRNSRLRLRVGSQLVDVPLADIARVEFGGETAKSRIVTRKGDTLSGSLETSTIELDLDLGPRLSLHPLHVRTLIAGEQG